MDGKLIPPFVLGRSFDERKAGEWRSVQPSIWANSVLPSSEKAPRVHLLQECHVGDKDVMIINLFTPEKQSLEALV